MIPLFEKFLQKSSEKLKMLPEIGIPDLNFKKHSPIALKGANSASFDGKIRSFVHRP